VTEAVRGWRPLALRGTCRAAMGHAALVARLLVPYREAPCRQQAAPGSLAQERLRQTLGLCCLLLLGACSAPAEVTVGSKKFTESVVLGEMAAQVLRSGGVAAAHRRELGGTRVLFSALLRGDVDVYPEYTGTIAEEILAGRGVRTEAELRAALGEQGIGMSRPLGFDNTYALGMKEARAAELGVSRISDLTGQAALRLGFSNEFLSRADGWPGLRARYRLEQQPQGLDHDLAYRGLDSGALDVTDLYSTDAEIRHHGLRVLEDDLGYFPAYEALWLYRAELEQRAPGAIAALGQLEGRIREAEMIEMNARAKLERVPEAQAAADFLRRALGIEAEVLTAGRAERLLQRTLEHLLLVAVSLAAAIVVAVPLGVAAARRPRLGQALLALVGVVQTIPSLALLVFMIPLLGIGTVPAIAALFLYSLLPIVRNTHAGLLGIAAPLRESAEALGLPPRARLRLVELPLASRAILAGIQTAAVINVGTATLGALIGAGGYGQPILTGIRLDDVGLILEGAVPAALLALGVQGLFGLLGLWMVPRGLRLRPEA
jgi:osmoprotectant transport system permease protein